MGDLHWTTGITSVAPNELRLRGYRLDELMGRRPFAEVVYLALKGELPTPPVARLFDALLVASIDHGATPPSCLAARTSAATGAPLNAALAAGILSINRLHGGAIEQALVTFEDAVGRMADGGTEDEVANALVAEARRAGQRLAGFGHRVHTDDPRTARLLALADEEGLTGRYVAAARAIGRAIERATGRQLPLNVDGAIAALLGELGFPPALANGFFILARVPGLMAHIREEQQRQRPMRRIHPTDHSYDGPPPRHLEDPEHGL